MKVNLKNYIPFIAVDTLIAGFSFFTFFSTRDELEWYMRKEYLVLGIIGLLLLALIPMFKFIVGRIIGILVYLITGLISIGITLFGLGMLQSTMRDYEQFGG